MINIALCCDKNYITQYSITVASILKFHPDNIDFYLIQDKMAPEDYAPLQKVICDLGKNCSLIPVEVGEKNYANWPAHKAWPRAVYFRLGMARLLPQIDKILYVDGDLLVLDDIQKIWDVPVDGHPGAAICKKVIDPHIQEMEGHLHFNNGVVIFNLKYQREHESEKKFLEIQKTFNDRLYLMDEDIMNLAFQDQMISLPTRWNVLTDVARHNCSYRNMSEEDWIEVIRHPAIIHFNVCKPWKTSGSVKTPFIFLYPAFMKLVDAPWGFKARVHWKCTLHLFQRYKYTDWLKDRKHMQIVKDSMAEIRKQLS